MIISSGTEKYGGLGYQEREGLACEQTLLCKKEIISVELWLFEYSYTKSKTLVKGCCRWNLLSRNLDTFIFNNYNTLQLQYYSIKCGHCYANKIFDIYL
jgi:hypothetical protein